MSPIHLELDAEDLGSLSRELQIDAMRSWFGARFEDPAESTPYNGREGGYLYIHGGPYDAREELETEFGKYVPEDAIRELVEELENYCFEWAPTQREEDPDLWAFDEIDDIKRVENSYQEFNDSISAIRALMLQHVDRSLENRFNSLLFANVVTALESYLSGKFIKKVLRERDKLQAYVETSPDFRHTKIRMSEMFAAIGGIETTVQEKLASITWHNLGKVKQMYENTFGIRDMSIENLMKSVQKRHHIVHRNGQDKNGNLIIIEKEDIECLISGALKLVNEVDAQLTPVF